MLFVGCTWPPRFTSRAVHSESWSSSVSLMADQVADPVGVGISSHSVNPFGSLQCADPQWVVHRDSSTQTTLVRAVLTRIVILRLAGPAGQHEANTGSKPAQPCHSPCFWHHMIAGYGCFAAIDAKIFMLDTTLSPDERGLLHPPLSPQEHSDFRPIIGLVDGS